MTCGMDEYKQQIQELLTKSPWELSTLIINPKDLEVVLKDSRQVWAHISFFQPKPDLNEIKIFINASKQLQEKYMTFSKQKKRLKEAKSQVLVIERQVQEEAKTLFDFELQSRKLHELRWVASIQGTNDLHFKTSFPRLCGGLAWRKGKIQGTQNQALFHVFFSREFKEIVSQHNLKIDVESLKEIHKHALELIQPKIETCLQWLEENPQYVWNN